MKQENQKRDRLNEIYACFTMENKNNLLKTAESLLKIQEKDKAVLAETLLRKEGENDTAD